MSETKSLQVLPNRSTELESIPARERDEILRSPCATGPAEDELPSNPRLRDLTRSMLSEIGEDPERVGLWRTPHRVAAAWEYLTSGYHADIKKILNGAIFEEKYDEMVVVK